jgi:hypothetical protein
LNQKGKVVADSFVLRRTEQEHWVWSPRTEGDILRERLESYLIADEVTVSDESAQWHAQALWGEGARGVIERRFDRAPAANSFVETDEAFVFGGRNSRAENFIVLARDERAAALRSEFVAAGATLASRDRLEAERIASVLPAVPEDIGASDLPNEGGLDRDAISYTKGCYLGQEVMSRLKNLGQVRRQLFVIAGRGEPPAPSTPVQQTGRVVGQTRSSARVADGFVAMAMLSLVNLDRASPLALEDGRPLELRHG